MLFHKNGKPFLNALLGAGFLFLISLPAVAQLRYPVKFVCGVPVVEAEREAVKPGNYATAINVHNPSLQGEVRFRKKAVRALPQGVEQPPPSEFRVDLLQPNRALEIDCTNIRDLLGGPPPPEFIKGFVVLLSDVELDVVAVYTAAPPGATGGMSIDVETILPRQQLPASAKATRKSKT